MKKQKTPGAGWRRGANVNCRRNPTDVNFSPKSEIAQDPAAQDPAEPGSMADRLQKLVSEFGAKISSEPDIAKRMTWLFEFYAKSSRQIANWCFLKYGPVLEGGVYSISEPSTAYMKSMVTDTRETLADAKFPEDLTNQILHTMAAEFFSRHEQICVSMGDAAERGRN